MKSYTDIEQSKKLAEILPLESADMYYCYGMNIHTKEWSFDDTPTIIDNSNQIDVHTDIPCWSLTALLNITCMVVGRVVDLDIWICASHKLNLSLYADNPIDAAFDMILRLHDQKLL